MSMSDGSYQIIDEKNWKRAMHCQVFRNSVEPAFCVTLELDITDFLKRIREKQFSFTLALVYAVSRCANEIEEFRYRFADGNDVFQFSPFPWVSYTHISHTNSGKKDNATPLFDWGKYYERDGRIILPFSVQAHHSFVDGIHIGKLIDLLQEYLNGTI